MQAVPFFWEYKCQPNCVHLKTLAAWPGTAAGAGIQSDSVIVEVVGILLGQLDAGMENPISTTPAAS